MIKSFLIVFGTVFLAEIGDKTQLATLLFASEPNNNRWLVFVAASLALVAAAAIGVLAGGLLEKLVSPSILQRLAGVGFVAIGAWMLVKA